MSKNDGINWECGFGPANFSMTPCSGCAWVCSGALDPALAVAHLGSIFLFHGVINALEVQCMNNTTLTTRHRWGLHFLYYTNYSCAICVQLLILAAGACIPVTLLLGQCVCVFAHPCLRVLSSVFLSESIAAQRVVVKAAVFHQSKPLLPPRGDIGAIILIQIFSKEGWGQDTMHSQSQD